MALDRRNRTAMNYYSITIDKGCLLPYFNTMIILTEKPSVAKDFATALKATFSNGYYSNQNIVITNCLGHLYKLVDPDFYNSKYKKWKISDLPIIPQIFSYEKIPSAIKQTNLVTKLLTEHQNDKIIIATDADREGELIARICLKQSGINNISNCFRFWVSEALTPDVVQKGLENLKPLSSYNLLSTQSFARQHADWLIGINFTRFISCGNSTVFSVGRVQTAILSAIAKRNYEVKNFVPVPYNELEVLIKDNYNTTIKATLLNPNTNKTPFDVNSSYIQNAMQSCNNQKITKSDIKQVSKINKPEKLLNINALQKAAYKLYGYSPEKTLKLAQSLYESHKCLSYPRTPSRVMGDDNVELFLQKFNLLKDIYPSISGFSKTSFITKDNKHIFDSRKLEAHHALIPLAAIPNICTTEEKNIFNIVIENFFTVCMDDYKYNEKQIIFYVNNFAFKTTLKEVTQIGFKINDRRIHTAMNDEQEVSSFNEKHCAITKLSLLNKKTQPQKNFSIDTLLTFMEKPTGITDEKLLGLGTPATRAEIIKKLFTTGYIGESNKALFATDKGMFLLKELAKDTELAKIANVSQTTRWEQELSDNPVKFEQNIKHYIVNCIKPELKEIYKKQSPGLCPLCGNEMAEGKLNFYCSAYKAKQQCKFVIWKNTLGANLSFIDIQTLLNKQKTKVKSFKSKEGKSFKAYMELDCEGKIKLSFPKKNK